MWISLGHWMLVHVSEGHEFTSTEWCQFLWATADTHAIDCLLKSKLVQ